MATKLKKDYFPFAKDPDETLVYARDFYDLLDGEEASDPTATCSVGGVEISNVILVTGEREAPVYNQRGAITGTVITPFVDVRCLIGGGTDGVDYPITFGVQFDDGVQNLERTVHLQVRDR